MGASLAEDAPGGSVHGMVYAAPFHRLVMIGTLYTAETFNITLSMIPTGGSLPAVTQSLADNVAADIAAWWPQGTTATPSNGVGFTAQTKLTSVKLNRIGPDGLYMDSEAIESVLGTPVAGASGANYPPQLTFVATLRGTNERARAGKGRMYLPPTIGLGSVGTDGRVDATTALKIAQGVSNLLGIVNDSYLTAGVNAVAGIASKVGAGAFQGVAQVSVGRVVDTMRSRRSKLDEDPQYYGAP